MTNKELFKKIYDKYSKEMYIHFMELPPRESGYSYLAYREIVLPKKAATNPSGWNVLALLHEVGHIKTNNERMRLFEKEYYATQWSANEARKLGFKVTELWKTTYQDYIFEKRAMYIKEGGRNVPPKEKLVIKW